AGWAVRSALSSPAFPDPARGPRGRVPRDGGIVRAREGHFKQGRIDPVDGACPPPAAHGAVYLLEHRAHDLLGAIARALAALNRYRCVPDDHISFNIAW